MTPDGYLVDFEVDGQQVKDWFVKDLSEVVNPVNIRKVFTEESVKSTVWDICKSYGMTGECIWIVLKFRLKGV